MHIAAMTPAFAAEVVTWRYPAPYDYYDMTGGGLRPDLTGRGLGRAAIGTGLDFGRERFAPAAFRVTIATFNVRAQRVVTALGFRNVASFLSTVDGRSFEILIRPEPGPPPGPA